ncbi:MAG: hypothetical protein ACM3XR_04855 [Bacillota bacterium]
MKIELFNRALKHKDGQDNEKSSRQRYEPFLLKASATALIVLVAAQAAMANPRVKPYLFQENYEGVSLEREAYLFTPCKMVLKLVNMERCPDLKVLVNGIERHSFEESEITLDLKDGDVVELDAGKVLVLAKVRINAVSMNIEYLLGKTVQASHGIVHVASVNCAKTPEGH